MAMSWAIAVGCNALQIIFILLIFWGLIIRLNRIEQALKDIKKD